MLARGQSVALISDAGTPGLSDPGSIVVAAARGGGHCRCPDTGPVGGGDADVGRRLAGGILHVRRLPAGKGGPRRAALQALSVQPAALVFYEAPHRIVETIDDLVAVLGGGTARHDWSRAHQALRVDPRNDAGRAARLDRAPIPTGNAASSRWWSRVSPNRQTRRSTTATIGCSTACCRSCPRHAPRALRRIFPASRAMRFTGGRSTCEAPIYKKRSSR